MKQQKSDSNNRLNTADIHINSTFLHLMQIHDSAFPIGNYTHSYGMETFIQENRLQTKEELLEFCKTFLMHNLLYGDVILIQEAYRATNIRDLNKLQSLDELCGAIKLAKESREASVNVGKQFMRTVLPLCADPFLTKWHTCVKSRKAKGHYAVVLGIYCALNEFDMEMTVMMYMYSTVNGLIQNAVRSVPFGQNTGVQSLYELLDWVTEAAKMAQKLTVDDVSNNALSIELSSMKHEYLHSRLFIS
ncbi:urease accessory protein UreF [Sporosarcina cascadiensis]|uniref:urease accessory protein UreF n=1 Tax=Sporosarcina cascadiensis TaxID=2660747 RepID=UPI001E48D904|nr:urease accessory protein UreF [Sporosarcina cascadiensis]